MTFEETRLHSEHLEIRGIACADARWERGQRTLTEDETAASNHACRYGSDGWPVRKVGRGWTWDRGTLSAPCLYRTRREAEDSWQVHLAIFRRIGGLQAQQRAIAEHAARAAEVTP